MATIDAIKVGDVTYSIGGGASGVYLPLAGGTMGGDIVMNGQNIMAANSVAATSLIAYPVTNTVMDLHSTYSYIDYDYDDDEYTNVPDINVYGRLCLHSAPNHTCTGVLNFGNGNSFCNFIGIGGVTTAGKFYPSCTDNMFINCSTITFAANDGYPYIQVMDTSDGEDIFSFEAQLRNCDLVSKSSTGAISWNPITNSAGGSSNFWYSLNRTDTTCNVVLSNNAYLFTKNYQYLLIHQSSNTCTVTLSATTGTIRTKGGVTSFTLGAGQSIEFCAINVGTTASPIFYVTYTIFN